MKFAFIAAEKASPVAAMCRVFSVTRQQTTPPSRPSKHQRNRGKPALPPARPISRLRAAGAANHQSF